MSIFRNKKREIDEEELEEKKFSRRKFKDINPEHKRKRKEPVKPWGKRERIMVLFVLLTTVITSAFLALWSRNYKLPGLPRLGIDIPSFNLFKEETIIIRKKTDDLRIDIQKEKAEKIGKNFKDRTAEFSGVYTLYVVNLNSDYSFGVGEDEVMQAASLIKLPVIAALYREGEKGGINLDAKYSLKNSDRVAGSGSLYGKPAGSLYTYRELAGLMGKQSDNTAFNIIRNILGDEKINSAIKEIGMVKTSLKDNKTTPKDIGIFFQKLYQGKIVSDAHKDEILDFLTDTIYENWLVAGIPDDVRVAHKYGREVNVVNDAGIVFSSDPFVLVLMSDGIVTKEADEVFPELVRIVYNGMIK